LIGADGISNENILYFDSRGEIGAREQRVEVFCNALAAEVLVPGEHLRRKVSRSDVLRDIDATIESLRKHYAVSREVIARRLVDTGFISRELYRKKRTQYIKEFEQRKAEEEQAKKPFRPAKPAAEVIRTNGRAFTRLILDAYGENILTASDVSSLLNTKLKNLASIEAEAFLGTPSRGVE
jgi:Zn-dependent peptidase ImmA (M78 family)